MARFETVPIGELKHRLPAKLMPVVEEHKRKLGKLSANQGGRLVLEKGTIRRSSGKRSRRQPWHRTVGCASRSGARKEP